MEDFENRSAGYLVNYLARLFATELQEQIRPIGLSTGVFPVMLHLWSTDGLTQRQLVDRIGVEQATMANTLSRMERDDLIERRADPDDRRLRRNWLTQRGRVVQAPAVRAAASVNAYVLAELADDDREQFLELARTLIRSIKRRANQTDQDP